MAPAITQRDGVLPSDPESRVATDNNYTPWLIVLIVLGSLGLSFIFIYLVVDRFRSKQYRETLQKDPSLTRAEHRRRRKMNALEREEEEELQRSFMIRKSLATRSSRSNSQVSVPR